METLVSRRGNSLGLRIPKALAAEAGLSPGDAVRIDRTPEGLMIMKVRQRPKMSLAELLARVTADNRHEAVGWGGPSGRELL
ncbi:AbrB/MazE/SpoVT family DNA-binding domain-containing protein [Desulfovibrio sulfodismutans]|uniref:AbrB/MazE/SpoVT family DNA-binding domain-containing protein n=1 Tax=Desulfolutivibrio sulfodismutans TaxID=63561 RepID=A0A7K3NRN8_9BACT|nr:AbrB/MazE/SpoVT family DNA-binding domain-containing protein [Desulfolutivibrio sulfodismutans]NDY58862.1 AbrB/MazE/SpoVT family DNA-binding domain-containing protein [Desulfolutivibrio sulfodismutans]QLA14322.1 AbrB/MazE/SpoVT family DNA-binding domain-containing protein [Desulfolutivibrio sulfodismutans DSM 3696]